MPEPSTLLLFAAASLGLLVVPGPAVLYIVTRSIDQGRRAGIASVLGVATGSLIHATAAALGLSALLLSSALAFNVVKYAGAAYLIALGVRTLLLADEARESRRPRSTGTWAIYRQGVVVNLLNPKTALFFFAFLPQFVRSGNGAVAQQILLLGVVFVLLGMLSDGLYALVTSMAGGWLRGSRKWTRYRRYVGGGIYLGLGITAATSGDRSLRP